ncbi:MAG TPA: hypothetical protein VFD47_02140 [Actinomycetota bacterium]|nr:hypothetical protein [Actinomycetota bacterium]
MPLVLRRLIPSAYRPVLANRVFRRLILGFAVSYLGDGMSFVAVAWRCWPDAGTQRVHEPGE